MGYPSISDFDEIFIKRTLANISKPTEYEFTQLINSLTGLIVLPRQWLIQERRKKPVFEKYLVDFDELKFLSGQEYFTDDSNNVVSIEKIKIKGSENALAELTLKKFIDKVRHSLCHQSIRPTREGENWKGVIFRNYQPGKKGDLLTGKWSDEWSFQLALNKDEILLVSEFIAGKYIE